MSVVGLTFGIGANASRPSAASAASVATSASTFADGCARSYQAKPAASASERGARNEASCQVMARTSTVSLRAQQLGALLGQQRAASPPRRGRSRWRSTSRR